MSARPPIRGGCACGRVRFVVTPPTAFASHCHCETCRRVHAAAFVTWTRVPEAQLALTGALAAFESSPGVRRCFCPTCGSHVVYRADDTPGQVYLPLATFDDAIDVAPDSHVSWEERVRWLDGVERLPCYRAKSDEPMVWAASD